ncbi:MAG TPA: hypothetical protein VGL39_27720 [Jatrophihabitantaceae bacterium]|jgi:hypothetical protein
MTAPEVNVTEWMNGEVRAAVPESGPFVPAELAIKIVDRLERSDPEQFAAWLRQNAVVLLTDQIGRMLRSERATARASAGPSAFAEWADKSGADGSLPSPALRLWNQRQCVNDANEWKREFELTKPDALHIASREETRGRAALMQGAFYKAVAKKVPNGQTIADVFTPETYQAMRDSIVGGA